MKKRKKQSNTYNMVKHATKLIRKKAPSPTNVLKKIGLIGKCLSIIFDLLLKNTIHFISFALAGIFYSKGDKPYKGSILYTIFYFIVIFFIIGAIIALINVCKL